MTSPVASRLIFLSDLPTIAAGDKVRFLGCVQSHEPKSGILSLQHQVKPSPKPVTALVNLDHVLESLKSEHVQVGAWVNVVGHVVDPTSVSWQRLSGSSHSETVCVQAVILWSAGSIDVQAYEEALSARLAYASV